MNSEFASKLAEEVYSRFPDYKVNCIIIDKDHAHLIVETGKACFAIREARGNAILSPVYADLARYIKHEERPAGWQGGRLVCSLDATAICDRIETGVFYLELFTDSLAKRKVAAKSDYQQAVATVKRLQQALPGLSVDHEKFFSYENNHVQLSGEASGGNVWLHIFCDAATALDITKGLKK